MRIAVDEHFAPNQLPNSSLRRGPDEAHHFDAFSMMGECATMNAEITLSKPISEDVWDGTGKQHLTLLIDPENQNSSELILGQHCNDPSTDSSQCIASEKKGTADFLFGDCLEKTRSSLALFHQKFFLFESLFWELDSHALRALDYIITFFAVILIETLDYQIFSAHLQMSYGIPILNWLSGVADSESPSQILFERLPTDGVTWSRNMLRELQLEVKERFDLDPKTVEWIGAVLLSWVLAVFLFGLGIFMQHLKTRLLCWWHYRPGLCRHVGRQRIPSRSNKPSSWKLRGIAFSLILVGAHAEGAIQTSLNLENAALQNELNPRSNGTEHLDSLGKSLCKKGGTSIVEGLRVLDRHFAVIYSDFWLSLRSSIDFSEQFEILDHLDSNNDQKTLDTDFCWASLWQNCDANRALPFESALAPAPWSHTTETSVEPTADQRFDHEKTSEETSFMQTAATRPGEVCGQHLDPVLYWDRLSYQPPIIRDRFLVWQTDVSLIGQLQRRLISIDWDGRSCVRCAFDMMIGPAASPMHQGPYYLRPQPQTISGPPILQFIVLETPKLSLQRAVHVSIHTHTGLRRGTTVINTAVGIISVQYIFDTLAPGHRCQTTSWCRVRFQSPTGYQVWWWPSSFTLLDFSHIDLDEFDTRTFTTVPTNAPPPMQLRVSQPTCPDPGGTSYDEGDENALFTVSASTSTSEDVSLMQSSGYAASRSHSSLHSGDNDLMETNHDSSTTDTGSDTNLDALVVYSTHDEAFLVPIGTTVTPDYHRIAVLEYLQMTPESNGWSTLTVHPVRPKPNDLAACVTPLIMINDGQHSMDKAFILLDLELHSNEVDTCGDKQEPYTLRETWTITTTVTRSVLLQWVGVTSLCRNRAFPCLVEIGGHPWLQQDTRPHAMLDGLFLRIVIHIPNPKFSLALYLHYSRQEVPWLQMESHWRTEIERSSRHLRQMFGDDNDNEGLLEAAHQAEDAEQMTLITLATNLQDYHEDVEDVLSLMGRPPLATDRQRSPRLSRDEMIIYEWHAQPHSTTLDPSLTRKDYRATIGAVMDVIQSSRLWNNFEFHQVRPLPADHDPLNVIAFIFVHPTTIVHGLSFVLVQISVTYETATCGRFETAIDRAVQRVPAFSSRETFLVNIRMWDLCIVSGNDQCEVRLPDRLWTPDDLENRMLFDGAYLQVRCTTPYQDIPVQRQLRASLNGMSYQTMIRTAFGGEDPEDDTSGLIQTLRMRTLLTREADSAPFRSAMTGLPPPGNTQFFDIADDDEKEEVPKCLRLQDLFEEHNGTNYFVPCTQRHFDASFQDNENSLPKSILGPPDLNTLDEVFEKPDGSFGIRDLSDKGPCKLLLADILRIPRPLRPGQR